MSLTPRFFLDVFSIVVIDLLLAGDNALVIALAVRSLPPRQRRIGSILGATVAVVLRVGLTFAAAKLLNVEFVKLAGGAFVLWIAVKVFSDTEETGKESASPHQILRAIGYIVFADITMSVDNVLAVAGASRGSIGLIVFGLGLSIPFVVASSSLLVNIMNRWPVTIYVGAAILGKVGAEMMITDGFVVRTLHPTALMLYLAEGIAIAGVLAASRFRSQA